MKHAGEQLSLQFGSTQAMSHKRPGGNGENSPKMTTLFAPTRFNPVPPASVEIKKIHVSGFLWNLSIIGIPGIGKRVGEPTANVYPLLTFRLLR